LLPTISTVRSSVVVVSLTVVERSEILLNDNIERMKDSQYKAYAIRRHILLSLTFDIRLLLALIKRNGPDVFAKGQ
jgi:hypothetical protein